MLIYIIELTSRVRSGRALYELSSQTLNESGERVGSSIKRAS
jgi:hypothetical protein